MSIAFRYIVALETCALLGTNGDANAETRAKGLDRDHGWAAVIP
jgi:hypothetical protein